MRFSVYIFLRSVALGLFCLGVSVLHGQVPLVSASLEVSSASDRVSLDWRIDAADRAMRAGLAGLAADGYRSVLQNPSLEPERVDDLRVRLAGALITQRRFLAASKELGGVSKAGHDSQYHLYQGIVAYGSGKKVQRAQFDDALKQVKVTELQPYDRPWWHLASGLRAELLGNQEASVLAFEKAVEEATTDAQRALFESLIYRQKLLQTPTDEVLATELRTQLEQFSTQASAFTYALEYAVILNNMGRSEDAVGVLVDQRLNNKELSVAQRERLLLLLGVITGPETLRGSEALRQLIRNGKTKESTRMALQLLASVTEAENSSLTEFLDEMVTLAQPHPLLGEIYYIRSQFALARAKKAIDDGELELARMETAAAEKDAEFLLEQFPGLQQIPNVYRLLAYAAIQREPKQYRAAADFLVQLRDQSKSQSERVELDRLIGDCYFLNKDYENAVDFYDAAYTRSVDGAADDGLFLRLVTAEVRLGQIDSAVQHIGEADFSGRVSMADRWRAEWNVAQALMANGQVDVALTRVRSLFKAIDSNSVTGVLDFRMQWLELYLTHLAGGSDDLLQTIKMLLARVEAVPLGELDESDAQLLITELILLLGQVQIDTGNTEAGVESLVRLRVGFADSSAAQRSYLTEADYHASMYEFKAAQDTLTKLASNYPLSNLAPQALFEAALYCEFRGAEAFEEAVLLHEQIVEKYPNDPLVFSVRLKQGDLLRKMNEFADAQNIYENLINAYPTHPHRYIPELSRADCMLALAKNTDSQLDDVIVALERLIDLPNLPIDFKAEVGYKWGFALSKRGIPEQAKEVFMLSFSGFLLDGEQATELGPTGRYWMSRTLLALGSLLEDSGKLTEARRVYLDMVTYNLPGRNLALDRANLIQVVDELVAE